MPVSGTHSPAMPATCGSYSLISCAVSLRSWQPVGQPALGQCIQAWQLILGERHHQLAAAVVGDAVFLAKGIEQFAPLECRAWP